MVKDLLFLRILLHAELYAARTLQQARRQTAFCLLYVEAVAGGASPL